jgi:hypothetical protein
MRPIRGQKDKSSSLGLQRHGNEILQKGEKVKEETAASAKGDQRGCILHGNGFIKLQQP